MRSSVRTAAARARFARSLQARSAQTSGELAVDGENVSFADPGAAEARGVEMFYQELSLIPSMTVAENILLGREPLRRSGTGRSRGDEGFGGELACRIRQGARRRGASRHDGGRAVRRPTANRRDPQGSSAAVADRRVRRGDRGAGSRPGGGRVRSHPRAEGGRPVGDLHFPPHGRGLRDRGSHHRDAERRDGIDHKNRRGRPRPDRDGDGRRRSSRRRGAAPAPAQRRRGAHGIRSFGGQIGACVFHPAARRNPRARRPARPGPVGPFARPLRRRSPALGDRVGRRAAFRAETADRSDAPVDGLCVWRSRQERSDGGPADLRESRAVDARAGSRMGRRARGAFGEARTHRRAV